MTRSITIKASHDAEAGVWSVEESDLFGLNAEADTLEELVDKLPAVISDLLEPDDSKITEIPVELIVHVSTRDPAQFRRSVKDYGKALRKILDENGCVRPSRSTRSRRMGEPKLQAPICRAGEDQVSASGEQDPQGSRPREGILNSPRR